MKDKSQKINYLFIKMMILSLIAQLLVLSLLIIFVKKYITHNQINIIYNDLLIKDQYTIDQIGQYKLLNSNYALDLELLNLSDMRKLNSIKFIPRSDKKMEHLNCTLLNSVYFKVCKLNNSTYLGISTIFYKNNVLGYVITRKNYSSSFLSPIKSDLLLIFLSILGIFIINFGFLFFPLKKKIAANTKYLLDLIASPDNSNSTLPYITIKEYKTIALNFIDEHNEIMQLQKEKAYYIAKKNVAEQVAHDIRSPLTAINIAVSDMVLIPENIRLMIKNACNRINDIANNLLLQSIKTMNNENHILDDTISPELIYFVLSNIVSEKNYEYHKQQFHINFEGNKNSYSCFSKINLAIFKRILSNLINNCMEAIQINETVSIYITSNDKFLEIIIKDNGCGIPADILPKITEENFSFGKKSGAGLGLFQAKQEIEKINGLLNIESEITKGTTVSIKILQTEAPHWFCEKLTIINDMQIVILDDDPTIHDSWKERFSQFSNIKLLHLSNGTDLLARPYLNSELYLIDYELLSENKNGLDLIEDLNLISCSVLVTNCFEDTAIRERCKNLGIKIIPKPYVQFIPLIFHDNAKNDHVVFIDDNDSMRLAWLFAAEQTNKKLDVYSHPNEFLKQIYTYSKNTPIYIDYELAGHLSGEVYAKDFYNKGYKKIYLVTGHPLDKFKDIPWIKAVRDKTPDF